jgi:hypothetical protein
MLAACIGQGHKISRELAVYKLDSVGVQKVRWEKVGTVRAWDYISFLWENKRKSSTGDSILLYTISSEEDNLLVIVLGCHIYIYIYI